MSKLCPACHQPIDQELRIDIKACPPLKHVWPERNESADNAALVQEAPVRNVVVYEWQIRRRLPIEPNDPAGWR